MMRRMNPVERSARPSRNGPRAQDYTRAKFRIIEVTIFEAQY
jgi:hypothetical protein